MDFKSRCAKPLRSTPPSITATPQGDTPLTFSKHFDFLLRSIQKIATGLPMADTINRVNLDPTQYVEIYTLTGISVGTPLTIQNNSTRIVKLNTGLLQPDLATEAYVTLPENLYVTAYINAGEKGVWALGTDFLSVQEDT